MRLVSFVFVLAVSASAQINLNIQTFGMVGIAEGQTARLNVLNVGVQAPALGVQCSAALSFLDDQGAVLKTATVTVIPGRSASLDLDADTDLKLSTNQRLQIRATIQIPPAVSSSAQPVSSCPLTPTLEIFDRFKGKTSVVMVNTTPVPQILRPTVHP